MKEKNNKHLATLLDIANHKIQGIEMIAKVDEHRAYGGIIRATKGKLLEELCKELVLIAWDELGGRREDIDFSDKTIKVGSNN